MDIAAWLRGLGLERYIEAFEKNDVDGTVLPHLSADDLREIGVLSVAHRRRLLVAIAAFPASHSEGRRNHWLDILAFFVACIALLTSIISTYQTAVNNRLSVVPYISISDHGPSIKYTVNGNQSFEIWVQNNGAGVAKITSLSISSDLIKSSDFNELMRVTTLNRYPTLQWTVVEQPYYLRAGDKVLLFYMDNDKLSKMSENDRVSVLNELAEKTKLLKIVVRYESIYGETNIASWPNSNTGTK